VRTLSAVCDGLTEAGHDAVFGPTAIARSPVRDIQRSGWRSAPAPRSAASLAKFAPQAMHIATEGPLGLAARAYCLAQGWPFTTAYHTRFPEYVRARCGCRWHGLCRAAAVSRAVERGHGRDRDGAARAGRARLRPSCRLDARRRYRRCFGRVASRRSICRGRSSSISAASRSRRTCRRFSTSTCPARSWWSAMARRCRRCSGATRTSISPARSRARRWCATMPPPT
jgi:hypothetical protein